MTRSQGTRQLIVVVFVVVVVVVVWFLLGFCFVIVRAVSSHGHNPIRRHKTGSTNYGEEKKAKQGESDKKITRNVAKKKVKTKKARGDEGHGISSTSMSRLPQKQHCPHHIPA